MDRGLSDAFGFVVRQLREARGIGLRRFARAIEVSPTYLSKIERGQLPPPAEAKILVIARELGQDPDILLALAGRVASDVTEVIKCHPRELSAMIRAAKRIYARTEFDRGAPHGKGDKDRVCCFLSGQTPRLFRRIRQVVDGARSRANGGLILVIEFLDGPGAA